MTSCDSMIAPCGIDCSQCEIFKAANDPQLAEETAKRWCESWQPKADASWFVCRGCRVDRSLCWTDDCRIYACCVEERGLDSCSICGDFPCEELQIVPEPRRGIRAVEGDTGEGSVAARTPMRYDVHVQHTKEVLAVKSTMIGIRLPEDIDNRLALLAKRTGRTKTYYAREAILRYIEDLEDTYVALERLKKPGRYLTMEEVKKELGLDEPE